MRILLIFCSLFLFASCHQRKTVKVHGVELSQELLAIAGEVNFDLTGHLDKAFGGDDDSLQQLFIFCENATPATLGQFGLLFENILEKIGDSTFAFSLGEVSLQQRSKVWAALENVTEQPLSRLAPETWAVLVPVDEVREYRGLYIFDRKTSSFRDCAEPNRLYIAFDENGAIERNHLRLLRKPYPKQAIFAEVRGVKTSHYANAELPTNYTGFFIVIEILELEAKNYHNTCIPYEVWGIGNDPGWQVQVSSAEGLIEFRASDSERVRYFPHSAPMVSDTATVYASVNESTGDNIRIVVKEGNCSDGQTEIKYNIQVGVTMNGKGYSGCGVPFEKDF